MKLGRLIYETPSGRILLVVLAILFALCAGNAHSASEPGTVTIVLDTEPEDLDPGNTSASIWSRVILKNVVEPLTEFNPADGSITPRLATSWKQVDANTWHFFLRKGVKFHDGEDFSAQAVIFSIKRLYNKKITSRTRGKFFGQLNIEGKALDNHTLELKTDKPEPLILTLMGALVICSPNTPLDKLTRNPIGTGPYKFTKWDVGTQLILESFGGYWGKQPQVKKAVYIFRAESAVRAAMVEIGEADLAPTIAMQDARRPDMDYSYFNSETTQLRIGLWEPPLNDRRVRLALNYAIDRDAIRGTILSKDVLPATQLVGPTVFGYNPNLKVWPYDPEKARQLLDEARKDGIPVDREILLVGRNGQYPGTTELMETVMTMYKAVGLNAKLTMLEAGVWKRYQDKPFPTNVAFLFAGQHDNTKDAALTVFHNYHCKGMNSPICDKTVNDLIEKAQVATGEERKTLWQGASKRIHEEIISNVFLFHMVVHTRVGKRINFKPTIATNEEIQLAEITFK